MFLGITDSLEYLKELGIGATWLSPIFKSPMYDFGYDIADFYAIQEEYGTMEDFENLMAKAKELGKVYFYKFKCHAHFIRLANIVKITTSK